MFNPYGWSVIMGPLVIVNPKYMLEPTQYEIIFPKYTLSLKNEKSRTQNDKVIDLYYYTVPNFLEDMWLTCRRPKRRKSSSSSSFLYVGGIWMICWDVPLRECQRQQQQQHIKKPLSEKIYLASLALGNFYQRKGENLAGYTHRPRVINANFLSKRCNFKRTVL